MNLLCVHKKCCLFKCVTKHCRHQKSFQDKTQISRIQPRSCTLSSEAHIHFHSLSPHSQVSISLSTSVYLWRWPPLRSTFQSQSRYTVIITEAAARLSWCKLESSARLWKPHSLKRKDVSKCTMSTPLRQKEAIWRQCDAPKRLQRGSSDKLPDGNGHDGWSFRAEWCPWCTAHRSLPVPICLHAISQTKSLSI